MGAWSLNHWTTREVPNQCLFPRKGKCLSNLYKNDFLFILHLNIAFLSIMLMTGSQASMTVPAVYYFPLVVQSVSLVPLFATPWTATHQASLSSTTFRSLLRFISTESVMLSNQKDLKLQAVVETPGEVRNPSTQPFHHQVEEEKRASGVTGLPLPLGRFPFSKLRI